MASPRRSGRPKRPSAKRLAGQSSKSKGKKRQRSPSSEELSSGGDRSDEDNARKKKSKPSKRTRRVSDIEEVDIPEAEDDDVEVCSNGVGPARRDRSEEKVGECDDDETDGESLPEKLVMKKGKADDVLTIFTEPCFVKFVLSNGNAQVLKGRWCNVCRGDEKFIKKKGVRKAFHVGSNTSCRQHIRSHFDLYKERCEEKNFKVHHYAIPPEIARAQNQAKKGLKQKKLDGMLPTGRLGEFSRGNVLKTVAEFIVGDSQVG
ncbi:hypothetical protein F5887DRAFT_893497 [Amanita rubescens]|nr:hypothetical protein F5887DRAFT_893497 [Amanita rubescens]